MPAAHACHPRATIRVADENGFALAQWARRYRPDLKVLLSAGLARKSEVAAHLCSHNNTSPPASYLRERIEGMNARHSHRARSVGRSNPRAAYR